MNFKRKRIVIMGLGSYKDGSGISAALFFAKKGAKLLITDLKTKKELKDQLKRLKKYRNIRYVLGRHRKEDFSAKGSPRFGEAGGSASGGKAADFIFKNPSVPKDSLYLKIARKNKIPIINDWTIFFEERPNNMLIGITGTKGKSTTAALIYKLLKAAKKDVVVCGNIGQSPLGILNKIKNPNKSRCIQFARSHNLYTLENLKPKSTGTVVVAELSSWLLHDFKKSPQIAVITNLMPDHLDKYKNLREYYRDKTNIFRFQKPNDYLILNKNDKNLKKFAQKADSRVIWFDGKPKNAVAAIAKLLKIPKKTVDKAINNFRGLPGRLELIAEKDSIKYYNDTTATTPDATIYALHQLEKTYPKRSRKIILVAGGVDKKLDYKNLAKEIAKAVKALILFKGYASEKILKELKIENCKLKIEKDVFSMKEAIKTAQRFAKKGDIILLSPASASFNMFKNEFDRGNQFNKYVRKIS